MPNTAAADLFVPEVWGDMSQAKFTGTVLVGGSAAVMTDDQLVGQPGNSVNFPKWNALGELDDLSEGVAMGTTKMSQTSDKATIREAGKAVELTDTAVLTALGNANDEAHRQFGILAARKVDAALIAQAQADETAQGAATRTRSPPPRGRPRSRDRRGMTRWSPPSPSSATSGTRPSSGVPQLGAARRRVRRRAVHRCPGHPLRWARPPAAKRPWGGISPVPGASAAAPR
ncbi:hypothetical protein [Streptomyces sp. NBC_00932]|uniref:hypothetical protein n=1 Tax=Streptomyces sp. NBC_00932 TaxID=2903690 RepID=UPI0038681C92|nr:hypothetical protein OG221_19580 [Streptomyces sp. NBC_00932]